VGGKGRVLKVHQGLPLIMGREVDLLRGRRNGERRKLVLVSLGWKKGSEGCAEPIRYLGTANGREEKRKRSQGLSIESEREKSRPLQRKKI